MEGFRDRVSSETDMPVIDIHQHLGDMPVIPGARSQSLSEDLDSRLEYMDRFGIDQAIVLPSNAGAAPNGAADRAHTNDVVAEYIAMKPDRFPVSAGTVHPGDGDLALAELDRCMNDLGFCGMVWHHRFLGLAIDHPGMDPLLTRLRERSGVAFIHIIVESGMEAPWRLEILADRHPAVTFVALDGFATFQSASWMMYIAQRHPNIFFDTGASTSVAHRFVQFVDEIGADRLLLGTDYYCGLNLFGHPFPLVEIRDHLPLSPTAVEAVLGGNAQRLLKLEMRCR
jgi:uncharacterized protein